MLNISKSSIRESVWSESYTSLSEVKNNLARRFFFKLIIVLFLVVVVMLFLPWTQNIQSKGYVTALRPDERPQTIQNTIPGKIEKWYVQEGDLVSKGDTILYLTEVKTEYFDPNLIERTKEQVEAKAGGINAYENKLKALDNQIHSLNDLQKLKIRTIDNKVKQSQLQVSTDSASWEAAKIDLRTAKERLARQEEMYEQGLISLTALETRRLKLQETKAKAIEKENKYGLSVNMYINTLIEQDQVISEFAEKISDVESKRSTAGSELYNGLSEMAKMKNQLANYEMRQDFYYVLAPRDGFITQAVQAGIGENIKENTPIITILPEHWTKAVEIYVDPIDLPLIKKGNEVMFLFDGWPNIVFTGWPELTYGTFPGTVKAIDYNISPNGKYRILIEESTTKPWPDEVRVGSGARGVALLNRVPVWYELWRQLNGFPPDYYTNQNESNNDEQKGKK
ncbi:HlyD family secretion protein [Bacteroidia bacterium]|jgi:adhesin transport system membrane fusion protein|nr:HlyD family secretion protein [Bacteroidia bacterium]MDB4174131.1 HlyD family secretion protein [Bacteroidia bacterium]